MKWAISPYSFSLFSDADEVQKILNQIVEEVDVGTVEYNFLHSPQEMLEISRSIERAVSGASGQPELFVGFQNPEKIGHEIANYESISASGVRVIAYGTGPVDPAQAAVIDTWVDLPEDRYRFENQWFLVSEQPDPVAFVGWEMSDRETWGKRPLSYPDKRFAGFLTKEPGAVGEIASHLREVALSRGQGV